MKTLPGERGGGLHQEQAGSAADRHKLGGGVPSHPQPASPALTRTLVRNAAVTWTKPGASQATCRAPASPAASMAQGPGLCPHNGVATHGP